MTDYPVDIQQHRQVGGAYPPRLILQQITESNQALLHVTYTSTYQNSGGMTRKRMENLSTLIATWCGVCVEPGITRAHTHARTPELRISDVFNTAYDINIRQNCLITKTNRKT